MKIFISDLHLGDGTHSDDFHRDKELIAFFEFVESQAQELIILGDFLELWQADLDRILFQHSEVISKLLKLREKIKVTYVVGNHDYVPFAKFADLGLGICLKYSDCKENIIAEHGFQYDMFNRYHNPLRCLKQPIGRYFAQTIGILEKLIHPNIDEWAKKALENIGDFRQSAALVRNKVSPVTKEYFDKGGHFGEFQEAVQRHIDNGIKIVIFGHIHRPELIRQGNGIYANCGAWVDNSEPTYIACSKEKIELRQAFDHKTIKGLAL
jgi:UDP-2,3-diacylglucosamine pyrophosphatase LpxH